MADTSQEKQDELKEIENKEDIRQKEPEGSKPQEKKDPDPQIQANEEPSVEKPPDENQKQDELKDESGDRTSELTEEGKQKSDTTSQGDRANDQQSDISPSEQDEIGIDLSDDELWDEGTDLDEIPLFEDELDLETHQDHQDNEEIKEEPDSTKEEKDQTAQKTTQEDEEEIDIEEEEGQEEQPQEKQEEKEGSIEKKREEDEKKEKRCWTTVFSSYATYLPFVITGLSGLFILIGIVVLVAIWPDENRAASTKPLVKSSTSKALHPESNDSGNKNDSAAKVQNTLLKKGPGPGAGIESINLSPFLIPAQKAGDLVFFKLHVELIVPDMSTKRALLMKEAWLRDAIYQELKGINVVPGKGNILLSYKRPLLERLNREFSPLRIDDIRLSGYLLK